MTEEPITRSQLDAVLDSIMPDVYRRLVRLERYVFGTEGVGPGGVPVPEPAPPTGGVGNRLEAVEERLAAFVADVDERFRHSNDAMADKFRELVEIVAELKHLISELHAAKAAERQRAAVAAVRDEPDLEPA